MVKEKIIDIKKKLVELLFIDKEVKQKFRDFQKEFPGFTKKNRLSSLKYLMRLNWAQYRYWNLSKVPKPIDEHEKGNNNNNNSNDSNNYKYYLKGTKSRMSKNELLDKLKKYDVISLDVFDTAVYRKVEFPNDVFQILAAEIGHNDFLSIRKMAEDEARKRKFEIEGHREITLNDIYLVLRDKYGVANKWMYRECELEIEISSPNLYIKSIYDLLKENKIIVFTTDMYLPKNIIEKILSKNGYTKYNEIILSNQYGLRKGDGTLQKILLEHYDRKTIIHIGDNFESDFKKTKEVGINAIYNADSRLKYREADMDNLAGSFYRAIINNYLNNGLWDQNLHFEHGFRVGGILTVGFCEYINKIVQQKSIDEVLFCSRDCEVIFNVYNKNYKNTKSDYINISRYAIMNITQERYLYDLIRRTVLRYADEHKNTKTLEQIFSESGYGYLVDYFEDSDLDRFRFPTSLKNYREKLEKFIFDHRDVIDNFNKESKFAAKKYFGSIIKGKKNILIVDIGWSGTCNTVLKYYIEKEFTQEEHHVYACLMCTSRNRALTTSVESGVITPYVYSPLSNMDLARFMMPAKMSAKEQDILHMPLEYLFTSKKASLVRYKLVDGIIDFEYASYLPGNPDEIDKMQEGILNFAEIFYKNTREYSKYITISPYVAFNPLKEAINHRDYIYKVYKNYTYDAFSVPYSENDGIVNFADLFETYGHCSSVEDRSINKKILFVTPELTYTGTPRSLLRMCKVAQELGYEPVVWSSKNGPFVQEYHKNNINVRIVPETELSKSNIIKEIKKFNMAICNTIVTDNYAEVFSKHIPTVWYIREATNIPDFLNNNNNRRKNLEKNKLICCVSEYAAKAISKYNKNNIIIIKNCVEDETEFADDYVCGSGETVKFVQFGTMEYRKGYDILIAAYKRLPDKYKKQVELYFAGGFINSGAPYCSYIFREIKKNKNIHYLGIVKGEKNKISTLSKMDVVVVASRDESCSLVALEGAMLSKPLILTENVGAKYMINGNGIITISDNVESMCNAFIYMVDNKKKLKEMGIKSRFMYEKYANMKNYKDDLKKLFLLSENESLENFQVYKTNNIKEKSVINKQFVLVSLTSHPGRVNTLNKCIRSLLNQSYKNYVVNLYLSVDQFTDKEDDLPSELIELQKNKKFKIIWVNDDLKPHKKYFYAMQEYKDIPIITVDDDIIYDTHMVEKFMNNYSKFPHNILCMRANMIMFKENGNFRKYTNWIYDCKFIKNMPSYQLLPTGVAGVLYPPRAIPKEAFNKEAIKENCLFCDDLWLKLFATYNDYPTVLLEDSCAYEEIKGTQDIALWHLNIDKNNNDNSLNKTLSYLYKQIDNFDDVINKIRQDRNR